MMDSEQRYLTYEFVLPPQLGGKGSAARSTVAVIGAGPVGLAVAIDLAQRGIDVVVLDAAGQMTEGSKAICWAKRTLEIFDRLGIGDAVRAKGVTWKIGRVYHRASEIYSFDLLPEAGHKHPAFVNLQQHYVESYLVTRARQLADKLDLRFQSKVAGLEQRRDHVQLKVDTPQGKYDLDASWIIACDGAHSSVREMLNLQHVGRRFEERFLIADVELDANYPSDRRFWFEPEFHPGQSALMHKQPDNIYRIDLQLGPDADPAYERQPEQVMPRLRKVLPDREFRLDWASVYSFRCSRLERFVHDRIIFAGDSAHVVSPFGARGGNSGIQDADNLGWKLAAVVQGAASESLLASYDAERGYAADENIGHSARTSQFMSPATPMAKQLRDEILTLAANAPFARPLVNAGRLSTATSLVGTHGNAADDEQLDCQLASGSPLADAPLDGERGAWLSERLQGKFLLLSFGEVFEVHPDIDQVVVDGPASQAAESVQDKSGLLAARYGAKPGSAFLFRPDGHLAARFAAAQAPKIEAARMRALQS